jgi:hypothetical protein
MLVAHVSVQKSLTQARLELQRRKHAHNKPHVSPIQCPAYRTTLAMRTISREGELAAPEQIGLKLAPANATGRYR